MDINLYFEEKGSGIPLILLHGNGENCHYFEHQIDYFSMFYRVIAVDTRGHGKSPRGSAHFSIRQFADDLHDFMLEHRIDRAHILGFSDGGNIALAFAMKYPEQVEKLIVNGANLNTNGVKVVIQRSIEQAYYKALKYSGASPEAYKEAEIMGLMVNDPNFTATDLNRIHAKTLVIAGTNDMIKRSHTRYIHRCIKGSVLRIIDGDHFIANKQWQAFNSEVEQFLDV